MVEAADCVCMYVCVMYVSMYVLCIYVCLVCVCICRYVCVTCVCMYALCVYVNICFTTRTARTREQSPANDHVHPMFKRERKRNTQPTKQTASQCSATLEIDIFGSVSRARARANTHTHTHTHNSTQTHTRGRSQNIKERFFAPSHALTHNSAHKGAVHTLSAPYSRHAKQAHGQKNRNRQLHRLTN